MACNRQNKTGEEVKIKPKVESAQLRKNNLLISIRNTKIGLIMKNLCDGADVSINLGPPTSVSYDLKKDQSDSDFSSYFQANPTPNLLP